MKVIKYQIHLDEPAIFSALEGDPNSAVSYPYIPGTAIRGLIIGLHLREHGNDPNFAADKSIQRRFFSESTRYLNAYPVIKGQRSLPVPASWAIPKYKTVEEENKIEPIYVSDSVFDSGRDNTERRKPKNLSGFVNIQRNTAYIFSPEREVNVHTQRARRDPNEQQVFRYEALASGQRFSGAILCENDSDAKDILSLLEANPNIVFGGSRSAGYGSATIEKVGAAPDNWQEVPDANGKNLVMTFVSDAILQDENGVYMPTPAALNYTLNQMGVSCSVDTEKSNIKTTWVGGFNRKWGLPLPQTIAIERGSIVQLSEIAPNSPDIQKIINAGIGERCEDGFGRVVIGWQQEYETGLVYEKYEMTPEVVAVKLEGEAESLWDMMRSRIRDRQLEERMSGVLYDSNYTIYSSISRTQISRLRTVIANELRKPDPQRSIIKSFLNEIKGKNSGRQFDNARIGTRNLHAWLNQPQFEEFGNNVNKNDRYVLQLIDTILERAYRERDKQAAQEEN